MVFGVRQSFQFFKQKTWFLGNNRVCLKGALSGLRRFLRTDTPLKMMKKMLFTSPLNLFCSQVI